MIQLQGHGKTRVDGVQQINEFEPLRPEAKKKTGNVKKG